MKKTIIILVLTLLTAVVALMYFLNVTSQNDYHTNESETVYCDGDGNRYNSADEARAAGLTEAEYGATFCPEYVAAQTGDYTGVLAVEAQVIAEARGELFRVVEIDGVQQPTTRDFQMGRINATVVDGVVTSYTVEGSETASSTNPNEAASGDQTNPLFQANELGGDMVELQNPPNDTDSNTHDQIIGMSVAEAEVYAETNEIAFRIGTIDGEPMPLTMDFRIGRITAETRDDIVIDYSVERE